jgi:hypothetical protein
MVVQNGVTVLNGCVYYEFKLVDISNSDLNFCSSRQHQRTHTMRKQNCLLRSWIVLSSSRRSGLCWHWPSCDDTVITESVSCGLVLYRRHCHELPPSYVL